MGKPAVKPLCFRIGQTQLTICRCDRLARVRHIVGLLAYCQACCPVCSASREKLTITTEAAGKRSTVVAKKGR